jgi:hypothetical protein
MTLPNPALEIWPPVSAADAEALVRLAVPYVRWLHPALVAALADDNTEESSSWHTVLQRADIGPDLYMWPGSACVFPGIRRKVGKLEVLGGVGAHSLMLDKSGNHLAHRVWERLGATQNSFKKAREGYELVHLFPHQAAEWHKLFRQQPEVADSLPAVWREKLAQHGLPGLFSNPANMCFLPSAMVRPTDSRSQLRHVLWQRALQLFGSAALLPPDVDGPIQQWLSTLPVPANLNWSTRYHGDREHLQKLLSDRHMHLQKYQLI